MQARFSPPSSLAAHHRRLMASCAESGCPQVRHRSGATLSARTVGESSCMSKSVEAHRKSQIVSARDLPTGCQQQCSLVVPTVRAARHLTEPTAKSHAENRWLPQHLGCGPRGEAGESQSWRSWVSRFITIPKAKRCICIERDTEGVLQCQVLRCQERASRNFVIDQGQGGLSETMVCEAHAAALKAGERYVYNSVENVIYMGQDAPP
jgi:hypothetical protein